MNQSERPGRAASWLLNRAMQLPGAGRALRQLLFDENGALFHDLFWKPLLGNSAGDTEAIPAIAAFGPDHALLYDFVSRNDYRLLRDLAERPGADFLRQLFLDHWPLLLALLEEDNYARAVAMAHRDGAKALRAALNHDAGAWLREYLAEENHRRLRAALQLDHFAFLKAFLSEADYALFRDLAQYADSAPLKAVLFDNDYAVLKRLLALNGHAALKAVVLNGSPEYFPMLARAREGAPLAKALYEDGAALFRHICRLHGDDALLPALEEDGQRYVHGLPNALRDQLAGQLLRDGARPSEGALLKSPALLEQVLSMPRAEGMAALKEKWTLLKGVLPADDPALLARFRKGLEAIQSPEHVRGRLLDAITEGDLVRLAHGTMQFPCRHSLWTLIHEILLNEDYYFECDSDAPVIIDGGAHMGVAIYYFKSLYPNARITAFEPEPALRAMAEGNVARNGYESVTVLPYALAGERKSATFHVSEKWSMAGALSDHRAHLGETLSEIAVECVPLSDYLNDPVDFLKLDIEGVEDEVLAEAAPKLGNVRHLFCEFHDGPGFPPGRLSAILAILEHAGFDVQVAKSLNYQETSRRRPLKHVGGSASQIIWAKRRA